ncbi:MAG: hypothetical protein RMJ07_07085 [Nitrososphaerota archaeon]|nr:hypothetical protein [Nitrososphaerota archaeon]
MQQRLILPYASLKPGRDKPFTNEMEKAAIVCLSEARRKKTSFIGTPEKIEAISKLEYPLWLIPWKENCIIVDGAALCTTVLVKEEVPSIKSFTEDLIKSSTSLETFKETLNNNIKTFAGFASQKTQTLNSVIYSEHLSTSLLSLVREGCASECGMPISNVDLLRVPEGEARERAYLYIHELERLAEDVDALKFALRVLGEQTEYHKEKIAIEIEHIWREYESIISEAREFLNKKIEIMAKEKEKEIKKERAQAEEKLKKLLQEEERISKRIKDVELVVDGLEKRRKEQKKKYPKRSTSRLDYRIEVEKKTLKKLVEHLGTIKKSKDKIKTEYEKRIAEVETRYLEITAEEIKKVEALENSRNEEISKRRDEISEIERKADVIESQIKSLIEKRNRSIKDFEGRVLPYKAEDALLIEIPFYLVIYESKEKKRFDVHPLVMIESYRGIVDRIKKALFSFSLESRMHMLLSPKSPEINSLIFESMRKSLEKDPLFREYVRGICEAKNLLKMSSFGEELRKGLDGLEEEGWITSKEKDEILKLYL